MRVNHKQTAPVKGRITDIQKKAFLEEYFDKDSPTFLKEYETALVVGIDDDKAKKLRKSTPWIREAAMGLAYKTQQHITDIDVDWIAAKLRDETGGERGSDRIRALELLGKWRGMFVDKVEVSDGKKLIILDGEAEHPGTPALLTETAGGPGKDETV